LRPISSLPFVLAAVLVNMSWFATAAAQQVAPVLRGEAFVGEAAMRSGTVVLHEVSSIAQGEVDSVTVAPDGTFTLRLPRMPDRAQERFYFASIRHDGILYFGSAIADAAQLDAVYRIQAYDTAVVAAGSNPIPLQARNIFFEPNGEEWRVTDIFQLRNDSDRTLVALDQGRVWSYPLPPGARDFTTGQGELSLDGTTFEDGRIQVRAAIAPGDRVLVFRYTVDSPFGLIPTPGVTETFDLLVREPSPRVGVDGLELVGRVELEAGSTYRRYSAVDVTDGQVRLVQTQLEGDLPVEWITVLVGLALAAAAVFIMKGRAGRAATAAAAVVTPAGVEQGRAAAAARRQALILEVARLDEEFEAKASPNNRERSAYQKKRDELLGQLRARS